MTQASGQTRAEPEPAAADRKPLHGMFTAVPPRYDRINRTITWGLDVRWRRRAAQAGLEDHPRRLLDLGCGTGDLAIEFARRADAGVEVFGLDYSAPMLERARRKAKRAGCEDRITFVHGTADAMPFPDHHFDAVGISFAFRNLTYRNPLRDPHLAEVLRVLRPGGRYVIVESSQPESTWIRALAHLYLRAFIGPVAGWLSGQPAAYRYLAESARRYYNAAEVKALLEGAGFVSVRHRPLLLGAAALHVAFRP